MSQKKDIVNYLSDSFLLSTTTDDYSDIEISKRAKDRLARILLASRSGLVSSSALICEGPKDCPFKARCPIYLEDGTHGKYPVGKQCIVEANLVQDRFMSYVEELNLEGKVLESLTYRSQISALVDLDLREFRINMVLAGVGKLSDGTLLHEQTIGVDDDGEEIKQLQEHPAWRILQSIRRTRLELLDAMGLTVKRDAMIKAALHQRDTDNFLTKSIDLLEKISNLERDAIK
jgi:hypothetical protein